MLIDNFSLCYQICYLEAHEYKKVNQAFLLSAAKLLFSKIYLDLFAYFPFKMPPVLSLASPHKDHLPQVSEAADPVTPAKSNSQ